MSKPNYQLDGINDYMWNTLVKPYVLSRDGFKCVNCGSNKRLHIHHKVKGVQIASNLITLCFSCHKKEHQGRLNFTNNHKEVKII